MNCAQLAAAVKSAPLNGWACRVDGDFLRLETPLKFPDGGTVELYVEVRGSTFVASDFGEAFRFLESAGIDPLRSVTRGRMIDLAAQLGSASIDDGVIEIVSTSPEAVMSSLVRLGQVVTRVADLSLYSKGALGNTFSDELEDYLRIRTRGVEIRRLELVEGASETHRVDIVTRSGDRGVSAIEGLSALTASGANSQTAFTIKKFADIQAIGPGAPQRFAVLDNSSDVWTPPLRQQIARFADVIEWEKRDVLPVAIGGNLG